MSTSHPIENFDSQMQFLLLAYFQKKITVSPNETTESAWVDFLNYITDNFKCDSPALAYNLSQFNSSLDDFISMEEQTPYELAKEYVESMKQKQLVAIFIVITVFMLLIGKKLKVY